MFKTSHPKKEKQNTNRMVFDILSIQKKTIKKSFLDYLGCAIVFSLMTVFSIFAAMLLTEDASRSKQIILSATLINGFTIFFLFESIRRFIIFKKLNKIKSFKEDAIYITCKKVTFLSHPVTRFLTEIICIVFTDENGKKYYNVVKDSSCASKKEIKAKLINVRILLNCYANTNCVKTYKLHTEHNKKK